MGSSLLAADADSTLMLEKKKEWSIGTQSDRTSMSRTDETTYEYGIIFSFIIGKYIDKTDSNTDDVSKFWQKHLQFL